MKRSIFILVVSFNLALSAQQIPMSFLNTDTSILLKWYPENLATWKEWSIHGVQLLRTHINRGNAQFFTDTIRIKADLKTIEASVKNGNDKAGFISEILTGNSGNQKGANESAIVFYESGRNEFLFSIMAVHSDFHLAQMFGLGYEDFNVFKGETYLYRILGYNDTASLGRILSTAGNSYSADPTVKPILSMENNDIKIQWIEENNNLEYYGINILRSVDSGASYSKINDLPLYFGMVGLGQLGSFLDLNTDHFGYTLYKFEFLSSFNYRSVYSKPEAIQRFPDVQPPFNLRVEMDGVNTFLYWDFLHEHSEHIDSFEIYTSDRIDGEMKKIIGLNTNARRVRTENPSLYGYITVSVAGKNGRRYNSLPYYINPIDTVSPAAPVIVFSNCDTNGLVTIKWLRNSEPDLKGYQVYKSNSGKNEFTNISNAWKSDTVFMDTLNLNWITDSMYYYVVSSDNLYNESKPSDIISLEIINKTNPDVPLISECIQKENRIELRIIESANKKVDHYEIFRLKANEEFIHLGNFRMDSAELFPDLSVSAGNQYRYKIRSVNKFMRKSEFSPPVSVYYEKPSYLERLQFDEIWVDTMASTIYFRWSAPEVEISRYRIIQTLSGLSTTIGVLGGNQSEFSWKFGKISGEAVYSIIAYAKDGRRSL